MKCTKCGIDKEIGDFPIKNKLTGRRATICKVCQRAYKIAYYKRNKPSHYKRNQKKKDYLKNVILEHKQKGCFICNETCIPCLEFHHLDSNLKDDVISRMANRGGKQKLLEELKKCVLLCANCHRKVHANLIILPAPLV